jgi:arylsulfatase A-like enzyme
LVQNLDFAQTFLDAAGVKAPKDMQGESMVPLLTGNEKKWDRDAVYYHYYEYPAEHMVNRHYAIVTHEYKLIHYYFAEDRWELIDRVNDPMEMKNAYDDPAYADIRKELHSELDKIRKKYKDSPEISQGYLDRLIEDAEQGKVYGAPKTTVDAAIKRSRENKK